MQSLVYQPYLSFFIPNSLGTWSGTIKIENVVILPRNLKRLCFQVFLIKKIFFCVTGKTGLKRVMMIFCEEVISTTDDYAKDGGPGAV